MSDTPRTFRTEPRAPADVAIRVRGLDLGFGSRLILRGLDLDVKRGEVLGFVGGSGTGKSVLMRAILGLVNKRAGQIQVFGQDLDALTARERQAVERRSGVPELARASPAGVSHSALAKSVFTRPGAMQLTRMLSGPSSWARLRASCMSAALEMQ